jgi:hypothetical protein
VTPKKFILAFDIHTGWERAYVRGQFVERRVDNPAAINALLNFASDFKPDIWVFGGDQINCGPVSHWNRRKPRLVEGFKLADELDLFSSSILRHVIKDILPKRNRRLVWLPGNHEAWWDQFIEENPAVAGMSSIEKYLGLDKIAGCELYSQGEVANIGKCYVMHGDVLPGGKYHARIAVETYRRNMRFGHYHQYEAATLINPLDEKDVHTAISAPCLCSRGASYGKNAPNKWVNGFIYGYAYPDGMFHDTVVIMTGNEFIANEKLYADDKKVELLKVA